MLKVISAGAGSGKTYTLTEQMYALLNDPAAGIRPQGIIATTFTRKAAAELEERVRIKLIEEGKSALANALSESLIGTVHAVGRRILQRFAFEVGISPEVEIMADEDSVLLFNQSLSAILTSELIEEMDVLSRQLSLKGQDWRKPLKELTDVARQNNFDAQTLHESAEYSIASFCAMLDAPNNKIDWDARLLDLMRETADLLERQDIDSTKTTQKAITELKRLRNTYESGLNTSWQIWTKVQKLKVGKKSQEIVEPLLEFAASHEAHPRFHAQIRTFTTRLFELAEKALEEFARYKRERGLIDYSDMEVLVLDLLKRETIQDILREELDLLLVDEFQDTSPIQLEIFFRLTKLAKKAIWVGDPKQSIYGFRGAEPALMEGIISRADETQNLDRSWRSRADLVYTANGIFTNAFLNMEEERIVLEPAPPFTKDKEPEELDTAVWHWHTRLESENKRARINQEWMYKSIAEHLYDLFEARGADLKMRQKGSTALRRLRQGDIAILCRTNKDCNTMAAALAAKGFKVSIAQNGLIETTEVRLVLACLRFLLNKKDSLAIAEILRLTKSMSLQEIVDHRLAYLAAAQKPRTWAEENTYIRKILDLRPLYKVASTFEILNFILEKLDLRRVVVGWGNSTQRLDNIEALRDLALQYEERCTRLHTAASLGGLLLWLQDKARLGDDQQGAGEAEDAINVLTYHRSKGLEWGMVICSNLEQSMRDRVFGLTLKRTAPTDWNNPLKNRLLRYWVNPYGEKNFKGTKLYESIQNSETYQQTEAEARAEEARVLYVGLTRARDYLVFPTFEKKSTSWLNRVFQHEEAKPTLDESQPLCFWNWRGHEVPKYNVIKSYSQIFGQVAPVDEDLSFWEARAGERTHLEKETIESPDEIKGISLPPYQVNNEPISWHIEDSYLLDAHQLVEHFLLADNPNLSDAVRREKAERLLLAHHLEEAWTAAHLLRQASAFWRLIEQQGTPRWQTLARRRAFRWSDKQGRFFASEIDFIIPRETMPPIVLKFCKGEKTETQREQWGTQLAQELYLSREALDMPKATLAVYFVDSQSLWSWS